MTPLAYLLSQGITPKEFRTLSQIEQRQLRHFAEEEMRSLGMDIKSAM